MIALVLVTFAAIFEAQKDKIQFNPASHEVFPVTIPPCFPVTITVKEQGRKPLT